jgi:hypothetical protein
VADKINCLGVTFESSAGWKKQKLKTTAKGDQTLVAIEKCLARTPDISLNNLEKLYELLSESRTMYGKDLGPRWWM